MSSKKILFTSHTANFQKFNRPFMRMLSEQGYEVHYASMGEEEILDCDKSFVVPFTRSPFGLSNITAYKQLKAIINRERYDIIHTHTPMGSVVTRLAARPARKKGTRVIYTAHGFHFFKGAPMLNWLIYYPVERYMARHTDTLITINDEDYERAKAQFKTDVQYVPGVGIDPKKFDIKMKKKEKTELRKSLGLNDSDFVLLYPAELNKNKNQTMLIKAMEQLIKKHPDIHLLLPGKDSLNGYHQKLINKLGLTENVHILGYRNDIPQLLKITDVSVSASKREGLPVNIMEAIYLGKPIVMTDCRGNRDLATYGDNITIVKQGDYRSIANAISNVYENKSTWDITSSIANKISQKYCNDDIMRKMITIYKPSLGEPLRVLQVVTIMNRAGLETMLMNYYRTIDRTKVQFDFLVHRAEKGDYDDEIKQLGGRIYRFNPITIKSMPGYKKKMMKLLKNHPECKVVHSHIDALSALPLAAAKKAKIPLRIAHSHVNGFDIDFKLPMRYFMKTLISSQATHLAACSEEAGRFMFGNYRDITIIRNAIDIEKFSFNKNIRKRVRSELGIDNDFVIGHVGRFTKPKNHQFIIKLFAEIIQSIPNAKLILVGTGETQDNIQLLARQLRIEEHILFLGLRSDIPSILQAMDIFVLPSLYEGFGIVAIEAQASGLPCLVSDKVPPEIRQSESCELLSLRDNHLWTDKIIDTHKRTSNRKAMNVQLNEYEIRNASKTLQEIYSGKRETVNG